MTARARLIAVGFLLTTGGSGAIAACGGSADGLSLAGNADAGPGAPDATVAGRACIPGQQVGCTCPGGATGAQVCTDDGQGYGACIGCASAEAEPPIDSTTPPDGPASPDDATSPDVTDSPGRGGPDGSGSGDAEPDAANDAPDTSDASPDSSEAHDASPDAHADAATSDAGPCPSGLTCNVSCDAGTTTVTGTVYDPAAKNPLYDVYVYVPARPLAPLPKGVLTGADACSCGALFPSGAITSTTTRPDGTFTLTNVPVGASVPLVLQVGKWRRSLKIDVAGCQDNPQADKSLAFLGTVPPTDTDDNLPDIAVSTGGADSLECLMLRMGIPVTEYVAGAATTGHVHVFSGGATSILGGTAGQAESPPMAGAPSSPTDLWASQGQLMPYDVVLLSCEGGETYNANPPALEAYLNAGGRAFASHFHYAWFSGPLTSGQSYVAPPDWGSALATWTVDSTSGQGPIGGVVDTTLNGSTQPFSKGVALSQWLTKVSALGLNGVAAGELSIYEPRFNAAVGTVNTRSQPWISADSTSGSAGSTMVFSFDTPGGTDGGASLACGRAIYSDLHAAGDPSTVDTAPPPGGCSATSLSAQEKALEFMLFDLSSCVLPDTVAVPIDAGLP